MSRDNRIWNNMARFLSEEMDENEKQSFLKEMEYNQHLKSQFEKMKSTWKNFDDDPSLKFKDTGRAWSRLKENLKRDGLLKNSKTQGNTFIIKPAVRIAATVLLILGLGIPAVYFTVLNDRNATSTLTQSSVGGVSTVDLPDGSRIYLNEGAEVSYPQEFNEERSIHLRGEAFFEVMSDPGKPFRVHSGKIIVSVLGTSFNIKQMNNNPLVEVFVESGKVEISDSEYKSVITLMPGEVGYTDGKNIQQGELKNLNYLSWKTKEFIFIDENITDIFQTLESAYHVEIVTENLDVQNMKLTSTYMQQSIDAILETISAAFSLGLERKGEIYYLTSN